MYPGDLRTVGWRGCQKDRGDETDPLGDRLEDGRDVTGQEYEDRDHDHRGRPMTGCLCRSVDILRTRSSGRRSVIGLNVLQGGEP